MTQQRIIKKYPNRRLYDITLEDVRQLILEREDFVVRDARSGADLTRQVLMQIIAEHEEHGEPIFSTQLLTQVIRFRGDVLQGAMSSFLERSLGFFLEQQQQLRGQIGSIVGQAAPWSLLNTLAERNMELWKSFSQGLGVGPSASGSAPAAPASRARAARLRDSKRKR
jgi:polyhydroxyalkanoate synthesis repressor PhaR